MQDVLTVPWLVMEEVTTELSTIVDTVPATESPLAALEPSQRRGRWARVFVALSVAWCILTAVLMVAGALTPVRGNVLTYFVMMAGLFLAAFLALTCPRPDGDEEFITLGGYPVGQCTPSRNTLTGRL